MVTGISDGVTVKGARTKVGLHRIVSHTEEVRKKATIC